MFRILCEETYARAVPPALLAHPEYEWRIFPDLGGDYPLIYDISPNGSRAIAADSEEGRALLGGIALETLREDAVVTGLLRQEVYDAIASPTEATLHSGLYRMFAAIAAHASQASLAAFSIPAAADRVLASRFEPEEIALDLGPYREDVVEVGTYIVAQEAQGEPYWSIVADLLELP